jgi:hypothetical protein
MAERQSAKSTSKILYGDDREHGRYLCCSWLIVRSGVSIFLHRDGRKGNHVLKGLHFPLKMEGISSDPISKLLAFGEVVGGSFIFPF